MKTDCQSRSADHEASKKSRAEELAALAEAKRAITEMTTGAASHTYGASFIQLDAQAEQGSRLHTRVDLANFEVVNLLRRLSKQEHSAALAQLAQRISAAMHTSTKAGEDPFAKVKAMIKEMITKLEETAGAEASHKAYCDKEMGETTQKIDELKSDIEKHSAKIDKSKANLMKLKDETATLQAELAELAKSTLDANTMRTDEHKIYVQAAADLKSGLEGVRMALKVLREYYSGGDGASLVQQPEAPGVHSKSTGAGTSIIGMLEVVESDFSKNLANVEMNEDTAATAFQKMSMENKVTKSMKEKDVQYKTKEAANLQKNLKELASDLDGAQTELDAVLNYSANIRAQCETKPETYEERKQRRENEISGLKEALEILQGETVFMQKGSKDHRLRGSK